MDALDAEGVRAYPVGMARSYWGEGTVFITGGDADLVASVAPGARFVPGSGLVV